MKAEKEVEERGNAEGKSGKLVEGGSEVGKLGCYILQLDLCCHNKFER